MDKQEEIKKIIEHEYKRFRLCGLTSKTEFKDIFTEIVKKCLNDVLNK